MPLTLLAAIDAPTPVPHHNAALGLARLDLLGQCAGDVWKIHGLIIEGAYIDDLMAERAHVFDHRILEGPSGMI
jgi:hypothetical protein